MLKDEARKVELSLPMANPLKGTLTIFAAIGVVTKNPRAVIRRSARLACKPCRNDSDMSDRLILILILISKM